MTSRFHDIIVDALRRSATAVSFRGRLSLKDRESFQKEWSEIYEGVKGGVVVIQEPSENKKKE